MTAAATPAPAWRIALVNGPNLNLLGTREPALYGTDTLADVERRVAALGAALGATVSCAQRNGEGELVDLVHAFRGRVDGAIVNAGAYGHTSLALRDALVGVAVPFVEVHVTNVYARERERHRSALAGAAVGTIVGFGALGYELALRGLIAALERNRAGTTGTASASPPAPRHAAPSAAHA